jgi:hypothetical protein
MAPSGATYVLVIGNGQHQPDPKLNRANITRQEIVMKTFQIVTLTAAMAVAVTLVPALLGESKARADAGPTGTWSGSCFDASVANGVLYAKCYTNARDLRNVSIA